MSQQMAALGSAQSAIAETMAMMEGTQLRAALRASVHGNLWIMFPMVGSMDDIRRAKAFVQQAKDQLDAQGVPYSRYRFYPSGNNASVHCINRRSPQPLNYV